MTGQFSLRSNATGQKKLDVVVAEQLRFDREDDTSEDSGVGFETGILHINAGFARKLFLIVNNGDSATFDVRITLNGELQGTFTEFWQERDALLSFNHDLATR